MSLYRPRIIISALRGGGGKTILSLGLISAWREMDHRIAPFKKGPDYIDSGWLEFAADRSCHNLDPFLMNEAQILESFLSNSDNADISLVEGNRGLYDGLDLDGCCSTAELAKLITAPVLIVLDVTMATRTMAAIVKGCQTFDPELNIAGVILNRVAGSRQEILIKNAVEKYCDIPVVGSVPKLKGGMFPERHMGLIPYREQEHAEKAILWTKETVKQNLDLDKIWKIAHNTKNIEATFEDQKPKSEVIAKDGFPRIGFIRDRSFWFYYPENLHQLELLGATLVEINAITDSTLPQLDALYVGGGFPETQASALADNQAFRDALRIEIEKGLPVYAECGGFMYMGKHLIVDGKKYPMVGALPVEFVLKNKPQGHGYTVLKVERGNPYYPVGEIVRGHEFHYSKAVIIGEDDVTFIFGVRRGSGVKDKKEGMLKKNLLGSYTHVHAAGNPFWAKNLFNAALNYKKEGFFQRPEKNC